MKYYTKLHTEKEPMQITKDEVKYFLDGTYSKKAVADIINNGKAFRLSTPYRDIWTKSEDDMIPIPGFYGVCE